MSDTATAEAVNEQAATTAIIDKAKKISLASFGGGRKPSDAEQAAGGAFIGTIMGEATGVRVVESLDPQTGELTTYESITGTFRAVPAPGSTRSVMQAGTLYLPGGFHDDMMDSLAPKDATSGARKPSGNTIRFKYGVFCISANNKAGYSYVIRPELEEQTNATLDVFAAIEGKAAALAQARAAAEAAKGKKPAAVGAPVGPSPVDPHQPPAGPHKK